MPLACSPEQQRMTSDELFRSSLVDAGRIAATKQITDDDRSIYPAFGPGDSLVFYQRLLITDPADTFYYFTEKMIRPYGVNVESGELYDLSEKYRYPPDRALKVDELAIRSSERVAWAIRSPDSNVIAYETLSGPESATHTVYLAIADSVRQLSYGTVSCFLDRFSNTGRYLTAVYGTGPTSALIFDLEKDLIYQVSQDSGTVDYMTNFSSDDSMMVFVRSDRKYSWGDDFFGNIYLLKFQME